jgi:DNA uptake protein ComE-like DNA-binding protein
MRNVSSKVVLFTASLCLFCLAGCTRQDNAKIQHDAAHATAEAKQDTQQAAQQTKQALVQAENAVNAAAAGVKQGIDSKTAPAATSGDGKTPAGKLDLNNASRDQLEQLPGINRPLADEIISHRPYATAREVVSTGALTPAQYHRIAPQVAVQ